MRRADQIGAGLLLVFGVWFSAVALGYPYRGPAGPGSGFLPFWLGMAMAVLAALLLIGSSRRGDPGPRWLPDRAGRGRLLVVLGGTAALIALMRFTGMALGTALFLVLMLRGVERYSWRTALAVAAGTALVNHLVFVRWLRVPLPSGLLGF